MTWANSQTKTKVMESNPMMECKRIFESNGLNFDDSFYQIPDPIKPLSTSGNTITLVFVRKVDRTFPVQAMETETATNNMFQQKSQTFADIDTPANPNTFQQIQMEEEPVSHATDLPQHPLIQEAPMQTRFTDLAVHAQKAVYTNIVTGEEYNNIGKEEFKDNLLKSFKDQKSKLAIKLPISPIPSQRKKAELV